MRVKPFTSYIYVKADKPKEKTEGGIILPETAQENSVRSGVVTDIGHGYPQPDGGYTPLTIKQGQRILFPPYVGATHTFEGDEFIVMAERDIIGVIEDESN